MSEPKKVLIIGLDFAGKTSILNILNQKYNLMDNIRPTAGIERDRLKVMGIPVVTWDLGGQEKFRREYVKSIKYFDKTDSIFFVVDTLSAARFEIALQYFTEILIIFESLQLTPKLVLCLHKIDPNIYKEPKTQELIKEAKELFMKNARGRELSIYVTSIYDVKSIVRAFSKTLQELIATLQPFKQILKDIALQLELDGVVLFDENLMILGEYYSNQVCEELCLNMVYNSVYYMHTTNPQLVDTNFAQNFEFILNLRNKEKRFKFLEVKFMGWDLYLLAIGKEKVDINKINSMFDSMKHLFELKMGEN